MAKRKVAITIDEELYDTAPRRFATPSRGPAAGHHDRRYGCGRE